MNECNQLDLAVDGCIKLPLKATNKLHSQQLTEANTRQHWHSHIFDLVYPVSAQIDGKWV